MQWRHSRSGRADEPLNFWQTYSDLMAALLLVFTLLTVSLMLHSTVIYQEKIHEEEAAQAELDAEKEQQKKLLDQLQKQQDMLNDQQEQLEKMIGLKESIMVSLSEEFAKTDLKVKVDPTTGSIAFDSNILFSSGSYELTEQGKAFLDSFLPIYLSALLHGSYSEYISEIIIEGHTDTVGGFMYNLELSQKRALAVSQYCMERAALDPETDQDQLRSIITANGRAWSNPVYFADSDEIDIDASRRVEFKFRMKDDEMINAMKEILENASGS